VPSLTFPNVPYPSVLPNTFIREICLLTNDVVADLPVVRFDCRTLAALPIFLFFVLLLFELSQCLFQLRLKTFTFGHFLFFIFGFCLPKPEVDLSGVH
jgi:hypothetical protein